MATESIELSRFLPATPDRIYLAWLNGPDHAAMTGSPATVASTEVGGTFTAWDGYIDGVHVALEPGRRIVQAWRSDDFPAEAPESYLEVLLEPARGGTMLTLRHRDLPEGQGPGILAGWDEFYLEPMTRYFTAEARRRGAAGPAGVAGKAVRGKAARRVAGKKAVRKRAPVQQAVRRPTRKAARKPARRPRR
jgi:activator of HSP90 ATPase